VKSFRAIPDPRRIAYWQSMAVRGRTKPSSRGRLLSLEQVSTMQQHCAGRQTTLALRCSVAVAALIFMGCGDGRSFPKVYEVKGAVLVNGQPANDVQVTLNRISPEPLATPATPQAITDTKGEFFITSYNADDGAPSGEYVVTIEWRERTGIMKQDFEGVDRLGGAYAKIDKTRNMPGFIIKVEGRPLELPPFTLTQSPEAKARADAAKKGPPNLHGPIK
jgi:hypothetical protein